jgi:multicomponent K+:H+ antiporter subunit G
VAGIFALVGSFGLLRLPDPMTRLHAPTKATTLGVGGVLIASMVFFWATTGRISAHELMITLFLFLTAPITAHFIAKVRLHQDEKREDLPTPTGGGEWAGFGAKTPERGARDMGE